MENPTTEDVGRPPNFYFPFWGPAAAAVLAGEAAGRRRVAHDFFLGEGAAGSAGWGSTASGEGEDADVDAAGSAAFATDTDTDVADESGDPGTVVAVIAGVPVVRVSV
jgi:hypothetical protein